MRASVWTAVTESAKSPLWRGRHRTPRSAQPRIAPHEPGRDGFHSVPLLRLWRTNSGERGNGNAATPGSSHHPSSVQRTRWGEVRDAVKPVLTTRWNVSLPGYGSVATRRDVRASGLECNDGVREVTAMAWAPPNAPVKSVESHAKPPSRKGSNSVIRRLDSASGL